MNKSLAEKIMKQITEMTVDEFQNECEKNKIYCSVIDVFVWELTKIKMGEKNDAKY